MKAIELLEKILGDCSIAHDGGLYRYGKDTPLRIWFGEWPRWINDHKLKEGARYFYAYYKICDGDYYAEALGLPVAYADCGDELIGLWELEE